MTFFVSFYLSILYFTLFCLHQHSLQGHILSLPAPGYPRIMSSIDLLSPLPFLGSPATTALTVVPFPVCHQQSPGPHQQHSPPSHSSDFRTQNIYHNNEEELSESLLLVQPKLHLKLCLSAPDSKHRSCFLVHFLRRFLHIFSVYVSQTSLHHLSRYSKAALVCLLSHWSHTESHSTALEIYAPGSWIRSRCPRPVLRAWTRADI